MTISRRSLIAASAVAACATVPAGPTADTPDEVIALWPAGPPGGAGVTVTQAVVERPHPEGLRDRIVTGVTAPTLSVFRPARPDGSGVLIIPGGGYRHVVVDKEGFETARWLAARGSVVYVLLHRLPTDGWAAGPDVALQDAQRAMRVIRARAARDGVARLAVQGFSAGGHVASMLTLRWDAAVYTAVDGADGLSARPELSCLIYPVVTMRAGAAHPGSRERLLGPDPSPAREAAYSMETRVRADAPPVFLLHAADDPAVPVANTLDLHAALRRANVAAEMHIFEEGGHGFGLRGLTGNPVAAWPSLFHAWGVRKGVFAGP